MTTFATRHMNFTTYILKAMGICTAFFLPLKTPVNAILILILIDWLTGVYRSLIANRKFTSYRLRKSVQKTVSYIVAIIAVFILEQDVLGADFGLVKIVTGYIAMTELLSIYENLSVITGKTLFLDMWEIIKKKFDAKH